MSVLRKVVGYFDRNRHILGVSRAVEYKVDTLLRARAGNYFYTGNQTALYVRGDGTKLNLDLRDVGILNFIATDNYESDVTGAINNCLDEGSTYIDVGANLGIHTIAAAKRVGQSGSVIAIEANPHLHKLLRKNIALNGASSYVRPYHAAAWSQRGELEFSFEDDQHRVGAVVLKDAVNYGTNFHKVPAVTIDEVAKNARNVRLIKIDIEGREPFAIEGAKKTITSHDCVVVAEYHRSVIDGTYGANKYDDLVRELGLKPHVIENDGSFTAIGNWPNEHANLALIRG